MQICRYTYKNQAPAYGVVHEHVVHVMMGDIYQQPEIGVSVAPLEQVRLLAPFQPCKIVAVGRNYVAHAAEHGAEVPAEPLIFLKPTSSIIGPGASIRLPAQSKQVEHEAELAVVIGRGGWQIEQEDALDHVLGYCCANDVTARDLQRSDGQWTRAKGFDTFCPLGPWVETELDADHLVVTARVNGVLRQQGHTGQMVFPVDMLISYISGIMTLEPGDVILTGTPAGVGPITAGDLVEIEVEGIGVLSNPVLA
jgi:2-keto-4-pentenoate hydratase/2-oxohepta-3-ene-1,7-dioic acid hydratase in catechol pathway